MAQALRVALISGPNYDPLYEALPQFTDETGIDVHVGFRGDHPALNRHLEACAPDDYHLVSTHSKYAPSQLHLLAPLDDLLSADDLADFEPRTLDLARVDEALYGVPRLVDVRLLHYRTDLLDGPPPTWKALLHTARRLRRDTGHHAFAFPGRDSGLFGTFFELTEMGGSHLFPNGSPTVLDGAGLDGAGARWALTLLRTLYQEDLTPPAVPDWHFDEVHDAFRAGRVAMIGEWPGFYGRLNDPAASSVAGRFAVAPYPAGPSGRSLAYGGEHTFALTHAGREHPHAADLLRFLTAPQQQRDEAARGAVPPRRSVMAHVQEAATGPERERLQILAQVIAEQILVPPKLVCYPSIETVIWQTVRNAFTGGLPIDEAVTHITDRVQAILADC